MSDRTLALFARSCPKGLHQHPNRQVICRLQHQAIDPDSQTEHILVRSPSLKESCVVLLPPVTYMLKNSKPLLLPRAAKAERRNQVPRCFGRTCKYINRSKPQWIVAQGLLSALTIPIFKSVVLKQFIAFSTRQSVQQTHSCDRKAAYYNRGHNLFHIMWH